MTTPWAEQWRQQFFTTLASHPSGLALQQASLSADLAAWTRELTTVVVDTCEALGWRAAGRGHPLDYLPEVRHEYLSLDVMAFETTDRIWSFPVAVMELENNPDLSRIAYSLWKVLCVRCPLRAVYCYRPTRDEARELVEALRAAVITPMADRASITGETLIMVGIQGKVGIFPHGFFRSWRLDVGTGQMVPMGGGRG